MTLFYNFGKFVKINVDIMCYIKLKHYFVSRNEVRMTNQHWCYKLGCWNQHCIILLVLIARVSTLRGLEILSTVLFCVKSSNIYSQEAMSINKSLSALGDVISALSSDQQFIPYRNNKLTMLMQDSLGGNAKTLMFVNISPADYNMDETVISLT